MEAYLRNLGENKLKVLSEDIPVKFTASSPSKIGKGLAFSLPAVIACPGMTSECQGCYASKNRFCFKEPQQAYLRNLRLLEHFQSRLDVAGCSKALRAIIPRNTRCFRFAESGDFPDGGLGKFLAQSLDRTVRSEPQKRFWAYTRTFRDYVGKLGQLPNLELWVSVDKDNQREAEGFAELYGLKRAYLGMSAKERVNCPATGKGKLKGVKEACLICGYCWKGRARKDVNFFKD